MKADMLKRLVRAIAEGSQKDLDALAKQVVDSERRSGHRRVAEQLESILSNAIDKRSRQPTAFTDKSGMSTLPQSRRHGEELLTITPREQLQHHMVLPTSTEQRFQRIESEFAARERLGAYGLKPRKTVLLYGPPGCGKTLGAQRLAWNTGLPLLKVRFDALLSSYFGESAANLRSVFVAAKEHPCVLLLDECDFIARSRTEGRDIGEAGRIVNALLQLMDEYDAPGLLVATTNVENALDQALFRRFDEVFRVPTPGPAEVEELLKTTLSAVPVEPDIDWQDLVNHLGDTSAAMVVKSAEDAAKAAVLSGRKVVCQDDIFQAISEQRHDSPG